MKHDFYGAKYTVQFRDGRLEALRYGEHWRDLVGDKLVLSMLQSTDAERALLARAVPLLERYRDTGVPHSGDAQTLIDDINQHLKEQTDPTA
jgi:hypothetical protein